MPLNRDLVQRNFSTLFSWMYSINFNSKGARPQKSTISFTVYNSMLKRNTSGSWRKRSKMKWEKTKIEHYSKTLIYVNEIINSLNCFRKTEEALLPNFPSRVLIWFSFYDPIKFYVALFNTMFLISNFSVMLKKYLIKWYNYFATVKFGINYFYCTFSNQKKYRFFSKL